MPRFSYVSTAALWRIAVTLLCLRPLYCSAQNPDQFLDSGGVKIRYVIAGKGEPVVLIHPFAASAEIWEPIIKDLSQNYRVIAMDCRGHGKSDKPHDPKQYGIKMVDDVVRLLDHLEMKKATIVGYSMGGSIAIKMLTEHPDRFRAAIIGGSLGFTRYESEHDEAPRLGPSLLSGMPLSEAMIASAPADWPKPSPQQREMMKRMDAAQDPIALGAETVSHEGLWVDDVELKSITVPTLVIYGGNDRPAFYESAKSRFPNLQFKKIEGAGHGPAMQSPEFTKDIQEFLGQQVPKAGAIPSDSPAARQFAAWLDAYNSGNRAVLLKFFETNYPPQVPNIDREILVRLNMTGGYDFKKTEESSAAKFSGIVKARELEQYARVVVRLEAGEARPIAQLDVQMIPRPAEFPSPRASQSDALSSLRSKLEQEVALDRFSGAVLVASNGNPIFSGAYGLADRQNKISNVLQTRFRLGSMNKIFTAVAVLQLAEAGKIKLDDAIGKYIPAYPNREVAAKVQVRHLLTHTGGTGDIFGPDYNAHRTELRDLQDYVKLYGGRGLEFEPGSRWAYSNYGFLLLGFLIEKASGQTYYDYVRDHIFSPLGMSRTGSEPEDEVVPNRAVAYTHAGGDEHWQPNRDTLPYRGTSAGGGYSTVEDLLRFANALTTHKLLSPKSLDLLVSGEPVTSVGKSYSFGSGGRTWDGVRYFGHNGGFPGMNGDLEISLQSGYTIIVLANIDPPAAQRISEFIGSRLPESANQNVQLIGR